MTICVSSSIIGNRVENILCIKGANSPKNMPIMTIFHVFGIKFQGNTVLTPIITAPLVSTALIEYPHFLGSKNEF